MRRFFFCGREDLGSIEVGMDSGMGSDMVGCTFVTGGGLGGGRFARESQQRWVRAVRDSGD